MLDEILLNELKVIFGDDKNIIGKAAKNARSRNWARVIFIVFILIALLDLCAILILKNNKIAFTIIIPISLFGILLVFLTRLLLPKIRIRLSKNLNRYFGSDDRLKKIYEKYLTKQLEIYGIRDVKFYQLNFDSSCVRTSKSRNSYLSSLPAPSVKTDLNYISFIFNNKETIFRIDKPVLHSQAEYGESFSEKRNRRTSLISSIDNIFIKNEKLQQECYDLKIRIAGRFAGEYKTESIEFNNRYSTNLTSNDAAGPKFLTPIVLDTLSGLADIDFFSMGVNDRVYMQKVIISQEIYPIGIFDFTKLRNKKDVFELITKKMTLELDLIRRSLSYISTIR
ncbi:hypothetical protein [Spiroplasma diminutum]|uniref:DUF3137 domain-containing protein n=1 Tax=Spiroplasma diminutum CUAS-1 TaxID=1276221 RepID=S5MIN8_9MOLU|nr:hypothetical protein [Spiroplasma diminutum]AGR41785.1 hypothetical protein SDIMI_v3c00810 [Spiroplasma diminutum CUAS-1]